MEKTNTGHKKYWLPLIWCALIVAIVIVGSRQMATIPEKCNVIMALEFAHSVSQVDSCVAPAYCTCGTADIVANTSYDYFFIVLYTALIMVAFVIFWRLISYKRIPRYWWFLMAIPGSMDYIENWHIIHFASSPPSYSLFWLYMVVVRIKWAFAMFFVMLILLVAIYLLLSLIDRLSVALSPNS
jgi:hypothetical protein